MLFVIMVIVITVMFAPIISQVGTGITGTT
jgi:hypothetical protein